MKVVLDASVVIAAFAPPKTVLRPENSLFVNREKNGEVGPVSPGEKHERLFHDGQFKGFRAS